MPLPQLHPVSRRRADTYPEQYIVQDADGAAIDITTGYSFTLAVDPSEKPATSANNLFTSIGTIIDGPTGRVDFPISTANADQTPGNYFYEAQMTDLGGIDTTFVAGPWRVEQDIVK